MSAWRTARPGARSASNPNAFRYAAPTGTVAIRWEGARAPTIWTVAAPEIEPGDASRELARRYLHIFGPTTADGFARWAGISRSAAAGAFASLEGSLLPVRSPLGDELLLAADEPAMRAGETSSAPTRLLPSGDAYYLLARGGTGAPRPRERISGYGSGRLACGRARSSSKARYAERGDARSTSCGSTPGDACRVAMRDAIEAEAGALPLPGIDRSIDVVWDA